METVAPPPVDDGLHFLTEWGNPNDRLRERRAAAASVGLHVALILTLVLLPSGTYQPKPPVRPEPHVVTPLIEPPTELTQKAPNKGKISKEFNAVEIEPRPRIHAPAGPPSPPPQRASAAPRAMPSAPAPRQAAPIRLPEPPQVAAAPPPPIQTPPVQAPKLPAPQIQAEEKPKSPFLTPNAPNTAPANRGQYPPAPDTSVSGAVRQLSRSGTSGAGLVVTDPESGTGGGAGSGINLPPVQGSPAGQVQLLSDPLGVDFRPYLIRVLATVKLHWLAVIPESVRLGRRGLTVIQFSIARNGGVPKLVIATPSGADALDRAAVAGISASTPFPPLPSEYKGDRIILQFNFAYNMPKP